MKKLTPDLTRLSSRINFWESERIRLERAAHRPKPADKQPKNLLREIRVDAAAGAEVIRLTPAATSDDAIFAGTGSAKSASTG
jgi:hypothetical protein